MRSDDKALPYRVKHCLLPLCKAAPDDSRMEEAAAKAAIPGILEALRRLEDGGTNNAAVAAACGITPQSVLSWKRTGRIGKKNLLWLSQASGMTAEEILDWRRLGLEEVPAPTSQPARTRLEILAESIEEMMGGQGSVTAEEIAAALQIVKARTPAASVTPLSTAKGKNGNVSDEGRDSRASANPRRKGRPGA